MGGGRAEAGQAVDRANRNRNLIKGSSMGIGQVLFSLNNIWASVNATGH